MAGELRAADIMTQGVIAIPQDASVQDAAAKMREEDIRSLVVIQDDEAVGIVVGRDIVYQVVSDGHDPAETPVSQIMTENLVTASEDDAVEDIAAWMVQHDISRVPILRGDQLVGIVTQSNIMQAWPSYIDLLREENQLYPFDSPADEVEVVDGECDACENFSDELVNVDGEFLCPECRVTA